MADIRVDGHIFAIPRVYQSIIPTAKLEIVNILF